MLIIPGFQINLMDILGVDAARRVVRCEPLVTVQRLVEALVPQGWIVPIVPESPRVSLSFSGARKYLFSILIYSLRE